MRVIFLITKLHGYKSDLATEKQLNCSTPYVTGLRKVIGKALLLLLVQSNDSAGSYTMWIGSGIYGAAMASIFPTCVSCVEMYMDVTGPVNSIFVVGASLGEMVLPFAMGLFISDYKWSFIAIILGISNNPDCTILVENLDILRYLYRE